MLFVKTPLCWRPFSTALRNALAARRGLPLTRVLSIGDVERMADYAADTGNPPEARLRASARVEAMGELAAESRELRLDINLAMVRGSVAGLQSVRYRHPQYYGSLLDRPSAPGQRRQVKREMALIRA